jgi:hypothetical protein
MADLAPAAELAAASSEPYPNDSAEYRQARTALLAEEIELRRHIERVAAQRRALPPGGEARDYRFRDDNGQTIGLADMFGEHDTLVTYFWMFGPQRERPCPMCTAFLGSLDIPARDITQRVALAVIGRSPVERQLAFARERQGAPLLGIGDGRRHPGPRTGPARRTRPHAAVEHPGPDARRTRHGLVPQARLLNPNPKEKPQ